MLQVGSEPEGNSFRGCEDRAVSTETYVEEDQSCNTMGTKSFAIPGMLSLMAIWPVDLDQCRREGNRLPMQIR